MIRLQGITKKYGNNLIIPKLDLTIYDGEFLTLLGPSGCGKTTLLRMIAGLDTPTTGKVFLDDEDVTNKPPYKRDVNMVFQHYLKCFYWTSRWAHSITSCAKICSWNLRICSAALALPSFM